MDASAPRRMQIARGLETLRKRASLTQSQVADRADLSTGTVSRYLDWRTTAKLKAVTVRALAMACGGTQSEVDTLARLADATAEGWWVGNEAVPAWLNPLFSLESEAAGESVFATSAVPGLLQTRAYAMAQHLAEQVREDPDAVEPAVDARITRQSILDRTPPFRLSAVLDEAVLRRVVGSPEVMAEQMDHLLDLAARPTIDVRILPFTAGAYSAVNAAFLMLEFDGTAVIYVEMPGGGTYLDQTADVARYTLAWDHVRSQAADAKTTTAMLEAARKEYRR